MVAADVAVAAVAACSVYCITLYVLIGHCSWCWDIEHALIRVQSPKKRDLGPSPPASVSPPRYISAPGAACPTTTYSTILSPSDSASVWVYSWLLLLVPSE